MGRLSALLVLRHRLSSVGLASITVGRRLKLSDDELLRLPPVQTSSRDLFADAKYWLVLNAVPAR